MAAVSRIRLTAFSKRAAIRNDPRRKGRAPDRRPTIGRGGRRSPPLPALTLTDSDSPSPAERPHDFPSPGPGRRTLLSVVGTPHPRAPKSTRRRDGHTGSPTARFAGLRAGPLLGTGRSMSATRPERYAAPPGRAEALPTALPMTPAPANASTHALGPQASSRARTFLRSRYPPPLADREGRCVFVSGKQRQNTGESIIPSGRPSQEHRSADPRHGKERATGGIEQGRSSDHRPGPDSAPHAGPARLIRSHARSRVFPQTVNAVMERHSDPPSTHP